MEQVPELPGARSPPPIEESEAPAGPLCEDWGGVMDDEQLLGSAFAGDGEEAAVPEHASSGGGGDAAMVAADEAEPSAGAAGKRKRGRPPKSRGGGRAPARKKEKEEEEVCFICFDGGELVVCDRRGCPKVYHPDCVNRDAAFFRSKSRWNCGWHICSDCEKAAHFMCYTCTYSLCKACNKGAGFVCIRGNKGFCETCYTTVMLIESNEHSDGEKIGVSFNDKSSWDYLFKEYWLALKGNLSLTLEELSAAKSPWKRSSAVTHNEDSSDESYDANDDQESSDSFSEHHEGSNSSRKKVRRRSRNAADDESSVKQAHNGGASTGEDTEWASKELLEFVAHMKDGDTSSLSQFDVQALLLEYIKKNNLRDPRKKSQIICDSLLQKLFPKERVGHFEMLKLLESHFLMKEASQVVTDDNQGGGVDPDSDQINDEGYSDGATKISSDKRRKTRKRVEEREPQTNLDDYAAIDVHNIKLIYLRRSLMEDLIDDIDNLNEKVVGSFVRIRIPVTAQKQDLYRLVQVIGTNEAAEKYKIGKKMTDIKLEILNLDKTEVITIDTISNQEFTEEECLRLRQCVKCGLINRLTVGEFQEKARVLQAVRVDDWLESEKLRLGHLRDRASEKGRRKELRECVEKLQLLSTPEERRRRLMEIPEIHADPKMDPAYESADEEESDDKNQDNYGRSRQSFCLGKGREVLSSGKGRSIPSKNWNSAWKSSNTNWETNRSAVTESPRDKVDSFSSVGNRTNELSWGQGNDMRSSWGAPNAQANTTGMESGGWNSNQHAVIPEQSFDVALETTSVPLSTGISVQSITSETEKMWYYYDRSGKVQGPFSMTQLRKWSTTGYFPPDLSIWRTYEKQDASILLTDALIGKLQKDLPQWEPQHNSFHQPTKFATATDSRENKLEGGWKGNNNPTWVDSNQNRGNSNAGQKDDSFSASGNTELANANTWVNQSSSWSAPKTEVFNPMEGRIGSRGWETSTDINAWSGPPQAHNSLRPTAPFPMNNYQPLPYQGRGGRGGNTGRWNRGQDRGSSWNSNKPRGPQPNGLGFERQQSNWSSSDQQSSGELWKVQPANDSRNQWAKGPYNPPTPTQPGRGSWANFQGVVNPSSAPSTASQHLDSGWGTTQNTWSNAAHQSPSETMESNKASAAANLVGGWGSSSASSVLKQTNKTDCWDSWSTASPSMFDKAKKADSWGSDSASTVLKQTDNADVQNSWSHASPSMPDKAKIAEAADVSQIPERSDGLSGYQTFSQQRKPFECDAPAILENQSPLPMDGMNLSDGAIVTSGSVTDELSGALNKNQFLQGDCPSPTPLCERQELLVAQRGEIDPASAALALGTSDPPTHLFSEVDNNLQPASSVAAEVVADKGLVTDSEAQNRSPLSVMEAKLICPGASTKTLAESDSAQRSETRSGFKLMSESEGWGPTSDQKRDGSSLSPAPSARWEQNQTQKPPDTNCSEWSLPSPTPSTTPSGWDLGADSTSGNGQSNPWVSSDGSKPPSSSLSEAGTSTEPAQPSNTGWGSGAKDVQSTGWDHLLAPPNANTGTGTAQVDRNMSWGSSGSPSQANANSYSGWGTPAQGSTNANTGWGAPAHGNANASRGWGATVPGSTNAGTGWGAPEPGSTDANSGWGAPLQGSMNPNAEWGAPACGNAANPSWGVPAPGNSNPNPGWGTNQNLNWRAPRPPPQGSGGGTGYGNHNWGAHQHQNGERNDGGVYGPQNSRMQSSGGGGSSRPPPRGQGQRGICKFHESGYCKKGSSCNYLHT